MASSGTHRFATQSLSIRCLRTAGTSNSFSTSSSAHATSKAKAPKAKEVNKGKAFNGSSMKKVVTRTGKPPAPGERRAARKRIVLSNTNALEVTGMPELTPEAFLDADNVGRVMALPGKVVDSLRAVQAFKTTQAWGMFRRPGMLIRQDGIKLAEILEKGEQEKSSQVLIIEGDRATGKSMMLLQAMAAAFAKGWIVLHIPEAQDLTSARTDYTPIKETDPVQYSQNVYTATWLSQIAEGNPILSELRVSKQHTLPIPLKANISLAYLAELGTRDPEVAWPVFQALWEELTLPGRPPILMTLDGLNHACRTSQYRNAAFEPIHSLDLAILSHFFTHLNKKKPLPNGGAILAATSKGNAPKNIALDLAITQQEERQAIGQALTQHDPFKPAVERDYKALQNIEVMRLGGLSKDEARGLMEYWAASGVLRARVDEKTVVEKWALAGQGIVGEIERGALRMRI